MAVIAEITRARDGAGVCPQCVVADTAWLRLKGLLGRKGLEPDEGLLIRPAGSIHMFWMRFAIDAVFLDRDGEVLKVAADLRPWRVAGCRGSKQVLELPAGSAARVGLQAGDVLTLPN